MLARRPLLLACLALLPFAAPAAPLPVQVLTVEGEVRQLQGSELKPVASGAGFESGAEIRTGADGRLSVAGKTLTRLAVGGGSELLLHSAEGPILRARLTRGAVTVDSTASSGRRAGDVRLNLVRLRTRVADAVIWAEQAGEEEQVCLLRGLVEVQLPDREGRLEIPGQCVRHRGVESIWTVVPVDVLQARVAYLLPTTAGEGPALASAPPPPAAPVPVPRAGTIPPSAVPVPIVVIPPAPVAASEAAAPVPPPAPLPVAPAAPAARALAAPVAVVVPEIPPPPKPEPLPVAPAKPATVALAAPAGVTVPPEPALPKPEPLPVVPAAPAAVALASPAVVPVPEVPPLPEPKPEEASERAPVLPGVLVSPQAATVPVAEAPAPAARPAPMPLAPQAPASLAIEAPATVTVPAAESAPAAAVTAGSAAGGDTPAAEAEAAQRRAKHVNKGPDKRRWRLVLASFPDKATALTEQKRLRKLGVKPEVLAYDNGENYRGYRVGVGSYATRELAEKALKKFERKNPRLKGWVAKY